MPQSQIVGLSAWPQPRRAAIRHAPPRWRPRARCLTHVGIGAPAAAAAGEPSTGLLPHQGPRYRNRRWWARRRGRRRSGASAARNERGWTFTARARMAAAHRAAGGTPGGNGTTDSASRPAVTPAANRPCAGIRHARRLAHVGAARRQTQETEEPSTSFSAAHQPGAES
jgi:hypothetical protein